MSFASVTSWRLWTWQLYMLVEGIPSISCQFCYFGTFFTNDLLGFQNPRTISLSSTLFLPELIATAVTYLLIWFLLDSGLSSKCLPFPTLLGWWCPWWTLHQGWDWNFILLEANDAPVLRLELLETKEWQFFSFFNSWGHYWNIGHHHQQIIAWSCSW